MVKVYSSKLGQGYVRKHTGHRNELQVQIIHDDEKFNFRGDDNCDFWAYKVPLDFDLLQY